MAAKGKAIEAERPWGKAFEYRAIAHSYPDSEDEAFYTVHVPQLSVTGQGASLEEAKSDAQKKVDSTLMRIFHYQLEVPFPYSERAFRADVRALREVPGFLEEKPEEVCELKVAYSQTVEELRTSMNEILAQAAKGNAAKGNEFPLF